MKQFNIKFVYEKDGSGRIAPIPKRFTDKRWKSYFPSFYMAHEILEHGRGQFGAFYQELEAVGAALFIREPVINSSYIAETISISHKDYIDNMGNIYDTTFYLPAISNYRIPRYVRKKFKFLLDNALNELKSTINNRSDSLNKSLLSNNWTLIESYILNGYVKAKRRWKNLPVFELYKKINAIMEEESDSELEEYFYKKKAVFSLRCKIDENNVEVQLFRIK